MPKRRKPKPNRNPDERALVNAYGHADPRRQRRALERAYANAVARAERSLARAKLADAKLADALGLRADADGIYFDSNAPAD